MTCAYAVRVALKKFPGVESVDVSLNKGLAAVTLKPGNTVRPKELWEAIRKNGFTPKQTHVVVRGASKDGRTLVVGGTNELFDLTGEAAVLEVAKTQVGKSVTVEGNLLPAKDVKAAVPLDVKVIRGDK